jgi:hypothetical protein
MHWGRLIPGFGTIKSFTHAAAGGPSIEVHKADIRRAYARLQDPTVCVWEPRGGVGHASIFIQPPEGDEGFKDIRNYASLFPGNDAKGKTELWGPDKGDIKSGAGAANLLPGSKLEGEACSFLDDCRSESEYANRFRIPEHMITVRGLDIHFMQGAWNAIRDKPGMHYRLMRKNCSTIVARILRAGMTKGKHFQTFYHAHKTWWTPYDVLMLAEKLQ